MLKFGKNYCVIAAAMMGNLCLLFITKKSTIILLSIEYVGVGSESRFSN